MLDRTRRRTESLLDRTRRRTAPDWTRGGAFASQRHPPHAGFHHRYVEVEDETEARSRRLEICQHLRDEDEIESFHTLDVHDERVFHEIVQAIVTHPPAAILDRAMQLSQKLQPLRLQLDAERAIIGALEQSRPQRTVNGDGTLSPVLTTD